MKKTTILISIAIILLSIGNCKKKEDDVSSPKTPTNKPQISMNGAEGLFWTWKEYKLDRSGSYPYPSTIKTGSALIYFYDAPFPNYNQMINVGDVHCDGVKLWKQDTVFVKGVYASDTNINFNQDVTWNIQGNSFFKGFIFTDTTGFPYMSAIKCPDTLKRNTDFTVSFDTLINADSMWVNFFGVDTMISGKVNSITFRKNQIKYPDVPQGAVYHHEFFLVPYTHSAHLINGKKYYFKNQFLRYKGVWTLGK